MGKNHDVLNHGMFYNCEGKEVAVQAVRVNDKSIMILHAFIFSAVVWYPDISLRRSIGLVT